MIVTDVADRLVTAGSDVWRSSETTQIGAVTKPPLAKVKVQAVGEPLPVLMTPAKFVDALSIEGEVPQEDTLGTVPLEIMLPLFCTPKIIVPDVEETVRR